MNSVSRARVAELADRGKAALDAAGAAVNNELLTRRRVEAVETILRRGFFGRLRWLLTGE